MAPLRSSIEWVEDKAAPFSSGDDAPPMPHLPDERPRPLTPFSLPMTNSETSPFFRMLSFELRHKILCDAFGNQTIHLDLDYDHPMTPLRSSPLPTSKHGARNAYHLEDTWGTPYRRYFRPKYVLRTKQWKPKKWRWWSSVCHRSLGPPVFSGGFMVLEEEPWNDQCKFGQGAFCAEFAGCVPDKCRVGALGWLRSCRQAYTEGIDVLYRTNSFHMGSTQLMLNLPRLLLPSRLSCITSLELLWKIHPFREQDGIHDMPYSDYKSFLRLVEQTPAMFPHVRTLYISLQGELFVSVNPTTAGPIARDKTYAMTQHRVLEPVEGMIRRLGSLKTCMIAMPSSSYREYKQRAMRDDDDDNDDDNGNDDAVRVFERRHGAMERLWRPLEGCTSEMEGYWLCLGHRDLGPKMYEVCFDVLGGGGGQGNAMDCLYEHCHSPW